MHAEQLLLELHEELLVDRIHHAAHHILVGLRRRLCHYFHEFLLIDHRQRRRFVVGHVRCAVIDTRSISIGLAVLRLDVLEVIQVMRCIGVLLTMTQHAVLQGELAETHVTVERSLATETTKSIIDTFSDKLPSIFSPVGSHVATQVLRRPETSQTEGANYFSVGVVWVFSLLVGMFIVVW
jgi:hypothetical protein